ncbi:MAG: hypothetical protein R3C20_17805 [Planctomycetaceae bacterium]
MHQSFRDAMAAPSMLPEFQGRVVAVRTEEFWDMGSCPPARETGKDHQAESRCTSTSRSKTRVSGNGTPRIDELYAATFSCELSVLKQSVSNFDFHYGALPES